VAQVKGTVFLTTQTWVTTRVGEEGWRRVLAAVPPADRSVLEMTVPVGWYPLDVEDRLNVIVDKVLGRGDLGLMPLIGRFGAEQEMRGVYKFFLKALTPANVLEKGTEFWHRYQDTGTWAILKDQPGRVRTILEGWGSRELATHLRLTAYLGRVVELTGAKNARLEHPRCKARGDKVCEFIGTWEV
jgi:hypothetical protein